MSHSSATGPAAVAASGPAAASASRASPSAPPAGQSEPSAWVARWLARLPRSAKVIDLAAGRGRHLRLTHALGLQVLGVDRDEQALDEALATVDRESHAASVQARVLDLETGPWSLAPGAFDAVLVTNYLFRPRFALVCGLLAPGGLLIYETFGRGNEAFGRPTNPSFLLEEGELFERARSAGLMVLAYESGYIERPKPAIVQRICAARPPLDVKRFALG